MRLSSLTDSPRAVSLARSLPPSHRWVLFNLQSFQLVLDLKISVKDLVNFVFVSPLPLHKKECHNLHMNIHQTYHCCLDA